MSVNAALYDFENRERKPCRCKREGDECICADELRDRQRDDDAESSADSGAGR